MQKKYILLNVRKAKFELDGIVFLTNFKYCKTFIINTRKSLRGLTTGGAIKKFRVNLSHVTTLQPLNIFCIRNNFDSS